jgi:hypothetical protein
MNYKVLIFLLLLMPQVMNGQESNTTLSWPRISRENKPWTRWWWPGSIVDEKDLSAALELYCKAGLGGLELAVIYGVKGEEDKFIKFLSPQWMKMFLYTLNEAKRLNIGIDLANSSSWPFGGPWVTDSDASKYVTYKSWKLTGGENLNEPVIFLQEPFIRFNGPAGPDITADTQCIAHLWQCIARLPFAIDQVRFQRPLPLQLLMAFSDDGKAVDLTDRVDSSGMLNWTAPDGTWRIYAVFEGWHGKMVERAGPGGEGYVIDHFSGKAVNDYLSHFDDAFRAYDISYLRAYFNDSYEVDDARGQADWTPDLFKEFNKRRAYDLKYNLPALFQLDNPVKNARVLSDYRQTISDLILDKFTLGWTNWAHKQVKITRNQAHGSPGNILDLYAVSDIPETEGTDILRMKFATSAANVSGKKYVSAETGTWLGEHFSSTLGDVKKAVDKCFIAGVNHIFYHGTCFSPPNEPWPGFLFYASTEFTPANSFWNDFPILNSYIARVQSFTQSSKPGNDILMYFPIFDRFSEYHNTLLEHFDAVSPLFDGTPFKTAAEEMSEKGFGFDYISDLQISKASVNSGKIITNGESEYRTLIIPGCKFIPLNTFATIVKLAEEGATIIVFRDLPEDISGWADLDSNRIKFNTLVNTLNFKEAGRNGIKQAAVGTGKIISGDDISHLLAFAGIPREAMTDMELGFSRRTTENGSCYFILNQSGKKFEGWIPVSSPGKSSAIFNPMTGEYGMAETRITESGNLETYARLLPYESIIIETYISEPKGKKYEYYDAILPAIEIKGKWKVDFIEGGPVLPNPVETEDLVSWTAFDGNEVKNFSGTAKYLIAFRNPEVNADAWLLDLGKVCESARVFLNGKEIAGLIGPIFQVIIKHSQLSTVNHLEIKVSNLAANRIAYLDRSNVHWKKFYNINYPAHLSKNSKDGLFDASKWQAQESGLIGPVSLTPLKKR